MNKLPQRLRTNDLQHRHHLQLPAAALNGSVPSRRQSWRRAGFVMEHEAVRRRLIKMRNESVTVTVSEQRVENKNERKNVYVHVTESDRGSMTEKESETERGSERD